MNTNEYDIKVIKVVDGDTVDVDIDLGFGVTLSSKCTIHFFRKSIRRRGPSNGFSPSNTGRYNKVY